MAPATEGKKKKKKQTSFTDDPNPSSPQLQPSLPPKSPPSPCPATSLPPILSPPIILDSCYRTISSRISSYTNANWPNQHLSPIKLAAAGFFRLAISKKKDATMCAFCGA